MAADAIIIDSKYKFKYQEEEIQFLETHYSKYLHLRGLIKTEQTALICGYIKYCIWPQLRNQQDLDYNDIVKIIHSHLFPISNERYKSEVTKIEKLFKMFKQKYMENQAPNPSKQKQSSIGSPSIKKKKKSPTLKKKEKSRDEMSEWEAKYEEDLLKCDNIHCFNVCASIYACYDYDFEHDLNLRPRGNFVLIAPNKLEYILPGDIVLCYILHGGYRRKRPRGRWYFWTDIESLEIKKWFERHNIDINDIEYD